MEKGEFITTIEGINFYYGGYNSNGWVLVYSDHYNFHIDTDDVEYIPTVRDCERLYHNTY